MLCLLRPRHLHDPRIGDLRETSSRTSSLSRRYALWLRLLESCWTALDCDATACGRFRGDFHHVLPCLATTANQGQQDGCAKQQRRICRRIALTKVTGITWHRVAGRTSPQSGSTPLLSLHRRRQAAIRKKANYPGRLPGDYPPTTGK